MVWEPDAGPLEAVRFDDRVRVDGKLKRQKRLRIEA